LDAYIDDGAPFISRYKLRALGPSRSASSWPSPPTRDVGLSSARTRP